MYLIQSHSSIPYYNIALEDFLLRETDDDYFLIYRNGPSVIIGKHQNTLAEINYHFIRENNITIARRISGGGSVYNDSGNLNFSFILNGDPGNLVDYRKYTLPVIEFLAKSGIKANICGLNSLCAGERKISGNAARINKKRVLHHGTLLFSTNLENLFMALNTRSSKYNSKAIPSLKAEVANISDLLNEKISLQQFAGNFAEFISKKFNCTEFILRGEDEKLIHETETGKFSGWEWNFGYSPDYSFSNEILHPDIKISVRLNAEKGIIRDIRITDNAGEHFALLECMLKNIRHDFDAINHVMQTSNFENIIRGIPVNEFVMGMF